MKTGIFNESEKQFKRFVEHVKSEIHHETCFSLIPQGDMTIISPNPINIAQLHIRGKIYQFGGIRESVYDSIIKPFAKPQTP